MENIPNYVVSDEELNDGREENNCQFKTSRHPLVFRRPCALQALKGDEIPGSAKSASFDYSCRGGDENRNVVTGGLECFEELHQLVTHFAKEQRGSLKGPHPLIGPPWICNFHCLV